MGFFGKLKSSVYDPGFYEGIKKMSLGSVIGYFFLFVLLLTTVNTLLLSYDLVVRAPEEVRKTISEGLDSYPADLEVSIDDGKVSTSRQEPFFVPFPRGREEINNESLNNILVIDTKTPYSASQFDQYKTLVWLTSDSLFYRDDNRFDQRSIDLSEVKDFTINKDFINGWVDKINPWFRFVGPALLMLTFVGMFIGFSFSLVYFFFPAVLIFFLSSIFKWGLSYSAAYKTAVFSSSLSFIVDLILFNTGYYTGFFGFPFLFTLISLCVATVNLQNFERKS